MNKICKVKIERERERERRNIIEQKIKFDNKEVKSIKAKIGFMIQSRLDRRTEWRLISEAVHWQDIFGAVHGQISKAWMG